MKNDTRGGAPTVGNPSGSGGGGNLGGPTVSQDAIDDKLSKLQGLLKLAKSNNA